MYEDVAVELWMSRLGSSGPESLRVFRQFKHECLDENEQFRGLTVSQLVQFQQDAVGLKRFVLPDLVRGWINGLQLARRSKQTRYSQIHSLFLHNHASFPSDPAFKFKNCTPVLDGDLSKEDLATIIQSCKPPYNCIFLMMAQGLMGEREVCYVNTHHAGLVVEAVTKNVGIFRIPLPPRKRNPHPYFTMLSTHGDWRNSFVHYMRSTTHAITKVLFLNEYGNPLRPQNIRWHFRRRAREKGVATSGTPECRRCGGKTVKRLLTHPESGMRRTAYECRECHGRLFACELSAEELRRRKGIRTGKHPHEIRDQMKSRGVMSGADRGILEFMMGHKVDRNLYEKIKYQPGFAEREYRKALPWLNVLSADPQKIDRTEVQAELEGQKAEVDVMRRRLVELERKRSVFDDPLMVKFFEEKLRELQKKR